MVLVPAGKWHNITNTGDKDLKLYSIYAPAHHKPGKVQQTKEIADNDTDDERPTGGPALEQRIRTLTPGLQHDPGNKASALTTQWVRALALSSGLAQRAAARAEMADLRLAA